MLFGIEWLACVSIDTGYSCQQTKSSNLLADFLELRKASELVDNGINKFLLISLINSNGQNSWKWQYKGFYTPKIWPVPEKIAKSTKNIPINSFLFPLFGPTKIFLKYWSEINQKSVSNEFFWNCHVVIPFPGQGLLKTDIIGPQFIFLHIYYIRVINGAELIQRWLIPKTLGCVENGCLLVRIWRHLKISDVFRSCQVDASQNAKAPSTSISISCMSSDCFRLCKICRGIRRPLQTKILSPDVFSWPDLRCHHPELPLWCLSPPAPAYVIPLPPLLYHSHISTSRYEQSKDP